MNDFSTYSWKDKKEEVTIPIKDSKEVAEFLGIMVGDGGIDNRYLGRYEASVCCNLEEDYEYVLNYVIPLIFKLFNKSPSIKQKIKDNAIYTRIYSKAIVLYLMKKGLPKGKKVEAIIDINSLVSKEYVNHFLRGLADTDFCLRFKRKKNKGNQFHF